MNKQKIIPVFAILILSSFLISGCGLKKSPENNQNTDVSEILTDDITPYLDKLASEKIVITRTVKSNEEFKIKYKTFSPDGQGEADFKSKSVKVVDNVDGVTADEGKKLVLVEIAVHGNKNNKGSPATFNQIGDTPSPQFVMVDKSKNLSFVEETYFSDIYTTAKKLFELSKNTMDNEQWFETALVFQIDKNLEPDLAFRFTNLEGKTEFYDIED